MASFKSKANPFTKKYDPNGYAGKKFEPKQQDMLLKVVSYDLPKYAIVAERVADGKQIFLQVAKAAVDRCRASEKKWANAKWFGHLVDKRMESVIPVGDVFVAENAAWASKQGDTQCYECQRIHSMPSQDEGKNIQGLITVSSYADRVKNVQVWEPESKKMTDVDVWLPIYVDRLNGDATDRMEGLHPASTGFQFRVIDGGNVIEQSPCFDYISPIKDGEGNIVTQGRAYDGNDLAERVQEFKEYIGDRLANSEICFYKSYKASGFSDDMSLVSKTGMRKMRLDIMCNSEAKLELGGQEVIQGRNQCVMGIVSFTDDDFDKKAKAVIKRDLVQKLFVNGVSGNVHSFIRSPGGVKVTFHPELKVWKKSEEKEVKPEEAINAVHEALEDDSLFQDMSKALDEDDPFSN